MSTGPNSTSVASVETKRALLAARLRQAAGPIPPSPLSFAQQRLWFLDQLEPNSPLYNIAAVARVTGHLDVRALERSLNSVVARHEALRTRFVCLNETPLQVIDEQVQVRVQVLDLSREPQSVQGPETEARTWEEVHRPFDLSRGPLLRATVLRLGPEECRLVLIVHHIVADEWSLKIFFEELGAFYSGCIEGRAVTLPELPIQYADYAAWQRDWLQGQFLQRQVGYWQAQLGGNPPLTELPVDRPRGRVPSFRGATVTRPLGMELAKALQDLGRRHEATLFMVLLAAAKALLWRYLQQDDLVVGTPMAGRTRVETEPLIGCFVNTLPLRTNLGGNPSFKEILARVRRTTLEAYAHQDLPFERLVESLQPERSLSHMPFTRLMFVLNQKLETLAWPGVRLEFIEVASELAKFELTLAVNETSQGLAAAAEYNRDLFEPLTVARLLEHYEVLLRGLLAAPEARLSELPLLSAAERHRLLIEWNHTTTEYPRDQCVHEVFEAQADRAPQATAVTYGLQTITYGELNSRANQLAHYLRHLGVGPDVPVALCLDRSLELVLGMLAILKAGGAYVPLDASYPRERLAFMLSDTQAPVLLTRQSLLAHVPREQARAFCLDTDWELIVHEGRENLPAAATATHLAYIMYTSGSTGQPKGVAVPHRAVTRLVLQTNYIRLEPTDRLAQVSNVSFDAATFEIWGALLNGGQLVGIGPDILLSPSAFARELRQAGITAMFLTAAVFNQLAGEAPGAFETVRTLIAGGEALDPKWVAAVLRDRPPQRLINGYGPTENTTFTCCHPIGELAPGATQVPIGRPIANTQVYILDASLNPVPIGVPGELYAGGDGVARGYWNRPQLTAEKFIPNPFLREAGAGAQSHRLYRTGDRARYLPDGSIEFLGRIDQQVKIRGFRIELGEIETTLTQHPGVRECVVAVRGQGADSKRLVAYLVAAGEPAPNATELLNFLRDKLPEYMLPSAFVVLERLPLTPNGKVDRQALPAPDHGRPELEKNYVPPRDEVEAQLAGIWEKVLGVQPVGVEDRFFDLGGHSLLAVRVIGQMEKVFGRKLRLATIFQAPTIEQLAAIVREEIKESSVSGRTAVVEIQAQGSRPPLFLVHGAGGGMFWGYVNLSRHLGAEQPVYGFSSRGLDGDEEFESIEAMATQYLADLRAVQPRGPYFLGGYCFGGNVAFEMARQLSAQGQTVAFLALLNCAPPNSRYTRIPWTFRWGLRLARNLVYWANYFRQWTPPQRRGFFRWKWALLKRRLGRRRRVAAEQGASVEAGDLVDLSAFTPEQRRTWEAHIRALLKFHPQPYPGRVHLFRSPGHPLWCSFDPDYGWGDLAKAGVSITIVPGAHEKILEEPCVAVLAEEMGRLLAARQDFASLATAARFSAHPGQQAPEAAALPP